MAIETWDSPYIVIWLCLGVLVTVLTYGVRGYSGKINGLEAAFYSVVIGGLAILNGAALGQTMYDKTAKYDVLGRLGNVLGLSSPLIISGLILLIFYRFRVVKYPKEFMIIGQDVEISDSYLIKWSNDIFVDWINARRNRHDGVRTSIKGREKRLLLWFIRPNSCSDSDLVNDKIPQMDI